jgi:O-antigen/teichoic acid export membrane protein
LGLIARQSFKAGTITYIGALLGVVNSVYIYPKMLSIGQLGEIQYIFSTAALIGPLLLVGLSSVLVKYFTDYNMDESKKQLLYGLVFGGTLVNAFLFLIVSFFLKDQILQFFISNHGLSNAAIYASVIISAIYPFVMLSIVFSSNHGRIAIPNLLLNLVKLVLPLVVVFYYFDFYTFTTLIRLLVFYYGILCLLYFFYMRTLDRLKPTFNLSEIKRRLPVKEIFSFAAFSFLGSFGAVLMNQIDIQMIAPKLGTYGVGLYSWSFFIANALAIPLGLLASISTPLISKFWKADNLSELNKIYGQSSRSLIVISVGLFACVLVGLDDLFLIMPKGGEYVLAKWTVIILCIAKVIDMAAGLNSQILAMSKSYRYLLLFLAVSVIFNVGLNLILIPVYGIKGSAIATVISILVFNILKYLFLWKRYALIPEFGNALLVIPIALFLVVGSKYTPHFDSSLLNIFVYSGGTFTLYYSAAYKLRLSSELNSFINKQLLRFGIKPFD